MWKICRKSWVEKDALNLAIPPAPARGPNPHCLEKRASGSKKPCPFWKREFLVNKSPFLQEGTHGKLGNSSFCRAKGNRGCWTPKPSFPGMGGFGPLSGAGGIASQIPGCHSFLLWKLSYFQLELFCLQMNFFAYSALRCLLDVLSHCKQKSSNCEQKSSKAQL